MASDLSQTGPVGPISKYNRELAQRPNLNLVSGLFESLLSLPSATAEVPNQLSKETVASDTVDNANSESSLDDSEPNSESRAEANTEDPANSVDANSLNSNLLLVQPIQYPIQTNAPESALPTLRDNGPSLDTSESTSTAELPTTIPQAIVSLNETQGQALNPVSSEAGISGEFPQVAAAQTIESQSRSSDVPANNEHVDNIDIAVTSKRDSSLARESSAQSENGGTPVVSQHTPHENSDSTNQRQENEPDVSPIKDIESNPSEDQTPPENRRTERLKEIKSHRQATNAQAVSADARPRDPASLEQVNASESQPITDGLVPSSETDGAVLTPAVAQVSAAAPTSAASRPAATSVPAATGIAAAQSTGSSPVGQTNSNAAANSQGLETTNSIQATGHASPGTNQSALESGRTQRSEKPQLTPRQHTRLVERVMRGFEQIGNRDGTVRIRLHPPQLGSVQIQIAIEDGSLTANLDVETTAARDALLANVQALKDNLQSVGIEVERFDVRVEGEQTEAGFGNADPRDASSNSSRQRSRGSSDYSNWRNQLVSPAENRKDQSDEPSGNTLASRRLHWKIDVAA